MPPAQRLGAAFFAAGRAVFAAVPLPPVVRITLRAAGALRDATAFYAGPARPVAARFAGAAARASPGRLAETMRRTVPRAAGSLSSPPS